MKNENKNQRREKRRNQIGKYICVNKIHTSRERELPRNDKRLLHSFF